MGSQLTRYPLPSSRPAPLASGPQRELARSLARSEATTDAFMKAIDESSNLYSYAYWKSMNSLAAAAMLRQVASMQGILTPAVDQQLNDMTKNYLRDMEASRSAATHHLLQIANDVASGKIKPEGLMASLNRLLQG